jgi:arylsulfatase A-like enzyme
MTRNNILLITTDQQHYDAMGVTNPRIRTPALDRLCAEGTRFTRGYCPNPTCTPTRASMITGLYPSSHGAYSLGTMLDESIPTVGESFAKNGYRSTLIGKAHFQPLRCAPGYPSLERQPTMRDLDFWRSFNGPWYGFDRIEVGRMHADESHAGQHYAIWLEEHGLDDWRDYFQPWPPRPKEKSQYNERDQRAWKLPEELHHTRWIGERSIANLEDHAAEEQPFFLWTSFFDPHPPYVVSEPWASVYDPDEMVPGTFENGEFDDMPPHFAKTQEQAPDFSMYDEPGGNGLHGCHSQLRDPEELKKDIACYYGMTSFIDQEIGRILDSLDRLGLAENTLVVFSSDHGHFMGHHGLTAKGPFHYEDLVRVPWIVRQPGAVPAGRTSDAIQSLVDLPQSFLSTCGIEPPGAMQGVDQSAVWRGEAERARDHAIVENRHNPTSMHLRTYIDERYKLTVYREESFGEMFDLVEDPGERRNLWDDPSSAAIKAQLMHKFVQSALRAESTPMPRIAGA